MRNATGECIMTTTATRSKAVRKALGHLDAPIKATKIFSKPFPFDDKKVTLSWVAFTSNNDAYRANTYDGNLGEKATPNQYRAVDVKVKGMTELAYGAELPMWLQWDEAATPNTGTTESTENETENEVAQ